MPDLLRRFSGGRGLILATLYLIAGFAVVAVMVAGTGGKLDVAVSGWFTGAFGGGYNLTQTLSDATPLALVALGASIALRAGIITVGAEGQLILGATLAAVVAFALGSSVPSPVALTLGAVAGAVGGALWSLIPAIARVRWGVNEILSTLLANYLAAFLLTYLLRNQLRDKETAASPQSAVLPKPSQIPQLPVDGRIHVGIVLVVIIILGIWWWSRAPSALLFDIYGKRPLLAARLGLTPMRAILGAMLISGMCAGLAGWMQVAGVTTRLEPHVAGGIGFAGLAVAVLGRGNPIGIAVAAVVYASLGTGAAGVQMATETTPAAIGTVSQGILLLTAALALAAIRLQPRRPGPEPAATTSIENVEEVAR